MIYSVHGYYGKQNSRKAHSKIEAIVFAKDYKLAEELVKELFDGYPADFEGFTVAGGTERNINVIYAQHPELCGISPDKGYVCNKFTLKDAIRRYFK